MGAARNAAEGQKQPAADALIDGQRDERRADYHLADCEGAKKREGETVDKKSRPVAFVFLRKLNWDNIETSSTLLYVSDRLVA